MTEPSNKDPGKKSKELEPQRALKTRRQLLLYMFVRVRQTRKWWLLPVLLLLAAIGIVLNVFSSYNVLPAIYSLIP